MRKQQQPGTSNSAQNQFTAYLLVAVHNYKVGYLKKYAGIRSTELPIESCSTEHAFSIEHDFISDLPCMQQLENEKLLTALQNLSDRDRYIFLSRVLDGKSISQIAHIWHRTFIVAITHTQPVEDFHSRNRICDSCCFPFFCCT